MQANKGPGVIAVITIIVAISTVFVFARLFVRTRILGKVEVDDCLILLGLVSLFLSHLSTASHLLVIITSSKTNMILYLTYGRHVRGFASA